MYLVAVVVSVSLTTLIVGLTAALILERARRHDLAGQVAELRRRLEALERVDRNPLYRTAIEDQRAIELRAADSVAVGVEHMLNALRLLAPEMLRKDKRK